MADASPHAFTFRDYRLFWTARLSATLAQNCAVVVIGWQVYDIARRTMDPQAASLRLGLIGLAQFAPLFSLVLVAGWAADRIDRRRVLGGSLALQLLCLAALAAFNMLGRTPLPALFAVAAALGVGRAFYMPAASALGPNLVPPAALPSAIATNSIAGRIGGIAGPALGGYLYAWTPAAPYLLSSALFLVASICVALVRPREATAPDRSRHPVRQMLDGLAYVRSNKIVLGAISLDLFAVLLGGATAMLPVYARDILHAGPTGLGHLRAAPAVGAIGTAIWFAWRPLQSRVGIKMLAAVVVFGVATIGFGLSRSIPLSLACLVVLGAADMLSVYVRQSLIQLSTPDAMRGRVGAVSTLFVSASNELGETESGFLAALVGPVAAVVGGGVGAIAVTLLWARLFPALRLAHRFDGQGRSGQTVQA